NHLDVEGILWLESVLSERARACLIVSHDRYLLEHVATGMLELNRAYPAGVFETDGSYSEFLARRDAFLRGQAAYQESLANTVRREIEWLRRGAKARSTKAKGRIKEAGRLIEELEDSRARGVTATAGIDFTASQRRTLAPGGDSVAGRGRSVHVASWAKRFLFRPEQLEVPVGRLSGGEQARILIARLMREPADLLILDEPTNDLDIPTLEVLEDSLAEFDGALVLVTHDRFMLERVSTVILALDGLGGATTFADYSQWEAACS